MADSHDDISALNKAVEIFNEKNVGIAIHAGDFCKPTSLEPLKSLKCHWIGVYGNMDEAPRVLASASLDRIKGGPLEFPVDKWKVVVWHGHEPVMPIQPELKGIRVVIQGHTHTTSTEVRGETLFINPGELGGTRFGKKTFAICELDTLEVEFFNVD